MDTAAQLDQMTRARCHKNAAACTTAELYPVLLDFAKQRMAHLAPIGGKRRAYYLSMEFLMGRLLACNLLNLGLYGAVDDWLRTNGLSLATVEDAEPEPSLGNGGLGRLAACYLDAAASLSLPVEGVGLCYHFGLFRQTFRHNKQVALPGPWMQVDSWLQATSRQYTIPFGFGNVRAVMRDISLPGYHAGAGSLHLFDLATVDESLVRPGGIEFDKTAVDRNLTLFLYPDDSDADGRLLRVYQEYFLSSCAAQFILDEAVRRGSNLRDLPDYAVVQINDTHASLVIPEFIRLLAEKGLSMDEAITVAGHLCAYTNHTILAEALERWPLSSIQTVAPALVPILRELDMRVKNKYSTASLAIIDKKNTVHMARMDMHYGFSVNGVAALHTRILEESELKPFYRAYPEKFSNKTNGISFRRWLLAANRPLASYIESLIGPDFKRDASELEKLAACAEDPAVRQQLLLLKTQSKERLCAFLRENAEAKTDPAWVFDIQAKRLHEYKRQQLNALWLIKTYLDIKAGIRPPRPVLSVFGAKAAPAYVIAQDIIHLILCLSRLIGQDPEVRRHLQVVMVQDYNVSAAEALIPACDISEQISLASKEASGTGNMKFMLNGGVTLGTMDGANVEIAELVGPGNIYIFGEGSSAVLRHYRQKDYDPLPYYQQEEIGRLVDFIVGPELLAIGDRACLARLHRELIAKDWFMTLLDAQSYFATKTRMLADYEQRDAWARKMLANISHAGFFSADRAVAEYNRDIWQLKPDAT